MFESHISIVMRKIFYVYILFLFFTSCAKDETAPPFVAIFSPMPTDSFYVADSVSVNFFISDKNLTLYKIIVSNLYTHKIFYREDVPVSEDNVSIAKKIFVNVSADTSAYIKIIGVDKNGNTGGAGVKFKLKK